MRYLGTAYLATRGRASQPNVLAILGDRVQMARQLADLQCSQIADNILSPWCRIGS